MNSMNKLSVAVFLVAVIAIAPVFNQPPGFILRPIKPFSPPPNLPNRGSQGNPNIPPLGPRASIPKNCDLRAPKPFKDPSIVHSVPVSSPGAGASPTRPGASPTGPGASPTRQSVVDSAVNATIQSGGPDGDVLQGLLDAARKIKESKEEAAKARSQGRKKRTVDAAYVAPTTKTNMCTSVAKQIVTVRINNQLCDTIAPQEVLNYECASGFCPVSNGVPFLQRYYCEVGNTVWTSWYVYCRSSQTVEIASAEISINCCCSRYYCNFTPYDATSPLKF